MRRLEYVRRGELRHVDAPMPALQSDGDALVPLPHGVSARAAASASDNLTDAYRAVAPALREAPGAEVLVIGGTGSIGVYAVAFARALGASAVAYVDRHEPDAVAIARELGAEILGRTTAWRQFRVTVEACWQ